MAYTYTPTQITENGRDRMRFELGDTVIDGGGKTAALADEEYDAILKSSNSWKLAKYRCLEAICMKLSYEVDYSVSKLSYGMSDRAERWRAMLKDAKADLAKSGSAPLIAARNSRTRPNSFYIGIHENKSR